MFFCGKQLCSNAEKATAFVGWKAMGLWGRLTAVSEIKDDHGTLDFHSLAGISALFWDTSKRELQEQHLRRH